jgi:hypothetical protein
MKSKDPPSGCLAHNHYIEHLIEELILFLDQVQEVVVEVLDVMVMVLHQNGMKG